MIWTQDPRYNYHIELSTYGWRAVKPGNAPDTRPQVWMLFWIWHSLVEDSKKILMNWTQDPRYNYHIELGTQGWRAVNSGNAPDTRPQVWMLFWIWHSLVEDSKKCWWLNTRPQVWLILYLWYEWRIVLNPGNAMDTTPAMIIFSNLVLVDEHW